MKNAALLVFATFALFGHTSHANQQIQAHITKTFAFPVTSLEKVEQAMRTAADRKGDAMKEEAVYPIDSSSQVRCAMESPVILDGHLYGCVLEFHVDLGGGASATLAKMLYVTQSSAAANDLLSKSDANKSTRVDLKSPFDGGSGSTYFCNSENVSGSQAWACYLTVVD